MACINRLVGNIISEVVIIKAACVHGACMLSWLQHSDNIITLSYTKHDVHIYIRFFSSVSHMILMWNDRDSQSLYARLEILYIGRGRFRTWAARKRKMLVLSLSSYILIFTGLTSLKLFLHKLCWNFSWVWEISNRQISNEKFAKFVNGVIHILNKSV